MFEQINIALQLREKERDRAERREKHERQLANKGEDTNKDEEEMARRVQEIAIFEQGQKVSERERIRAEEERRELADKEARERVERDRKERMRRKKDWQRTSGSDMTPEQMVLMRQQAVREETAALLQAKLEAKYVTVCRLDCDDEILCLCEHGGCGHLPI